MNTVEDYVDAELRLGIGSHHTSSAADHRQQIAIFYNSQICACDPTEMQARAIISFAKMEQQQQEKPLIPFNQSKQASAVKLLPQLLNPRLTMKHSLQRFLQKRKARISASAPYNPFTPRQPPFSTGLQPPLPHQCP